MDVKTDVFLAAVAFAAFGVGSAAIDGSRLTASEYPPSCGDCETDCKCSCSIVPSSPNSMSASFRQCVLSWS
jgi:hypothetical protein